MDATLIRKLFGSLNAELKKLRATGEVTLCGGAVMCLVFKARQSTKDIDAVFAPAREMRKAIRAVAERYGLPENWLNDAAKGFFHGEVPREETMSFSNLRVYTPRPEYLLAMKSVAARYDTQDKDDVVYLIRRLDLKKSEEVFAIIEQYYPHRLIPAKTKYFLEELFANGPAPL